MSEKLLLGRRLVYSWGTVRIPTTVLALLAALLGVGSQTSAQVDARSGPTWIRIEGALDGGTQSLLRRAIDDAAGASRQLVLELDTPGGEIELMWRLARMIDDASQRGIESTAWVNDRALSAGALVAMSCDRIYMRSLASIGSAMAVQIGPTGLVPLPEDEREKMDSTMRSSFRAWAEEHGRSGVLAEAMVDRDVHAKEVRLGAELKIVTAQEFEDAQARGDRIQLVRTVSAPGDLLNLTGREALSVGFAEGLAETAEEVVEKIGLSGAVRRLERTRSEDWAVTLDRLAPLLLMAGFILAYMELKAPGFGVPGILSIFAFAIYLTGRYLVGLADIPHIVLVASGIVLLAVELLVVPGFLWTGVAGGVLLLGGLVLTFTGASFDLAYAMDQRLLLDGTYRFLLYLVIAAILAWAFTRWLPHAPVLSRLVLRPDGTAAASAGAVEPESSARVGARGRAVTDLRPVGKVVLDDDPRTEFEARATGPALEPGTHVRVLEVHGTRLVVEEVAE